MWTPLVSEPKLRLDVLPKSKSTAPSTFKDAQVTFPVKVADVSVSVNLVVPS